MKIAPHPTHAHQLLRAAVRPLALIAAALVAGAGHAEAAAGSSKSGHGGSASASIMITVTIPATVKMAPDGRSISSNMGKEANCTLTLVEGEPEPATPPNLNGKVCGIQRITKMQAEAGSFRGWTVSP